MSYIANEFICFDPNFVGEHGDFTDDTVFTSSQRREYLERYAKYLKKSYSLPEKSQYAVPFSEAGKKLKTFNISDNEFSVMRAYTKTMPQRFKNWNLFTEKARVEEGKLIFENADLPPNPSAEYILDGKSTLREIEFKFSMSSQYSAIINGIMRDTTTARTFEIRHGIDDILKIGFYSNGECYARHFSNDPYHSKFIKIGKFRFDEENLFKLVLNDGSYSVCLNEQCVGDIPYNSSLKADTLFFCSGMFHFGDWQITPTVIKYDNTVVTEFFAKENLCDDDCKYIGEVRLPYAIGCFENKNRQLILEKEFTVPDCSQAYLCFETLDPGGEVYIDGDLVYSTDGFDDFAVDVSSLDRHKSHLLRVVVFPRAPEVLFGWHRQRDSYNGWFCGEITLKLFGELKLTDLKVITETVCGNRVKARFCGKSNQKCQVSVFTEQIFGGNDLKKRVAQVVADGYFEVLAEFDANLWSTEKPNLYNVYFETVSEDKRCSTTEKIETGFRTVAQKNGEILLNGERVDLKGALLMQFLPPYEKTSQSHICPTDEEIVWQELMLKAMGGNTLRIHILGYGTNDARYARYADRLGILLIWTTRYIDSIEGVQWQGKWRAEKEYLRQVSNRLNHPSIIMWEGSNELRPNIVQINDACDRFVPAIKSVDKTRLICPVSHLYYAADCYPTRGCEYLSNDGLTDHNGMPVKSSEYWTDELVVRSAHTYSFLCGYGTSWKNLRTQPWCEQEKMLNSNDRAYIISEYAVIGRQDPHTAEAEKDYFNTFSYEFSDENVLKLNLTQNDWLISQAYQALCAYQCTKRMRIANVDGLLWCSLMGGANDGGYLKPLIDNYGYAKLGFYTVRSAFDDVCVFTDNVNVKSGNMTVNPILFGKRGTNYKVTLSITDENGTVIEDYTYDNILCDNGKVNLAEYKSNINGFGFYGIRFYIEENNS